MNIVIKGISVSTAFLIFICNHTYGVPQYSIIYKKRHAQGLNDSGHYDDQFSNIMTCIAACLRQDCDEFATSGQACAIEKDQIDLPTGQWIIYTKPEVFLSPFVRRIDGSVDFGLNWIDYKDGFGDPDEEFWLGLEQLHVLTSTGDYGLRVQMKNWDGLTFWAEYAEFSVGPAEESYKLSVSGFDPDSTAGDSLTNISQNNGGKTRVVDGMKFSTPDQDNDIYAQGNCAISNKGGWWFANCQAAKATGLYLLEADVHNHTGINWYSVRGQSYSFQFMEMLMKPN